MNVLYTGRYKKRFVPIIEHLKNLPLNSKILELCFGDTYIASHCRRMGHQWQGLDINKGFVARAQKSGFDASFADLTSPTIDLPCADVCVLMGSLYHFHPHPDNILEKMVRVAQQIVISEPVSNLSSRGGLVGFLARRAANAGKGHEQFRYDKTTLMAVIEGNKERMQYGVASVTENGKDLIVKLIKNVN